MSVVDRIAATASHNMEIRGYGSRIAFAALTCPGRRGFCTANFKSEFQFCRIGKGALSLLQREPSSLRTQGPIRRAACFERPCSRAFAQPLTPVVMGPRVRRDDDWERGAC